MERVICEKKHKVRRLEITDKSKGFIELLQQLTTCDSVSDKEFEDRFQELCSCGDDHLICVIEDEDSKKTIATACLFIEKKFIRNCGKVGHIEDVVVDANSRGLQLGKKVIDFLTEHAKSMGCYKVILDCSNENVGFYEKCGFKQKEIQMVRAQGSGRLRAQGSGLRAQGGSGIRAQGDSGLRVQSYSIYNGFQSERILSIVKAATTTNWWLYMDGNTVVGYWPSTLFRGLATAGNGVQWGGEVVYPNTTPNPTTTRMGSGHFAEEGQQKEAYIRNIFYLNINHERINRFSYRPQVTKPLCYSITDLGYDESDYAFFYYGGSGGISSICT